jgi:hypothetical protein
MGALLPVVLCGSAILVSGASPGGGGGFGPDTSLSRRVTSQWSGSPVVAGWARDPQFGRRRNEEPGISPSVTMDKQQQMAMNKERQQQLKRDTDRLLQLATELKLQVDKSNESVLALDVIRKAEEIEKLAHSVRTKMRGQ